MPCQVQLFFSVNLDYRPFLILAYSGHPALGNMEPDKHQWDVLGDQALVPTWAAPPTEPQYQSEEATHGEKLTDHSLGPQVITECPACSKFLVRSLVSVRISVRVHFVLTSLEKPQITVVSGRERLIFLCTKDARQVGSPDG